MGFSLFSRSFAAGELAPGLSARGDLAKYQGALRRCRNFIVRRHGGVANRPGTQFVAEVKSGGGEPGLYPFVFPAADESFVIEAGSNYFRFHRNGAPVLVSGVTAWSNATTYVVGDLASSGGVNYYCILGHINQAPPNATYWYAMPAGGILEIPTPWSAGAFAPPAPACFEQNGLAITISHLDHAPRELRFTPGTPNDRWVLSTVVTEPSIAAPGGVGGVAGGAGTRTLRYVVTAVKADTYEESNPSAVITIASTLVGAPGTPNVLSWAAVPGAAEYHVYEDPFDNGTYGFLGVATGVVSFNDVGEDPDFSRTPPVPRALFASTNNYPAVNTTHQQRRVFAGTHNDREQVFASQVGFRANFGIRSPLQDDDAVTFTIASNRIQPVHHLIGLQLGLVALTDSGEWVIKGDEHGTLLPRAINPRQHGYVGASFTRPVIVGESVLFVQNRGSVLRDLRFDERVEGLSGRDLCIYSAHLFNRTKTIVDLAYAQTPDSVVWAVRSDGVLCGLTYIRDEDVWGWHRHDTVSENAGEFDRFKRVCVLPENGEDFVYVVVEREVNNQTKRYIERFASRQFDALKDAVFLDCSKTITLSPASTAVTGLMHLTTRFVMALVDGVKQGPFTVSLTGTVTLTTAGTTVQIGIPITGEVESLDVDQPGSSLRDRRKRVVALALLLEDSARGFYVGPDDAHLTLQRAQAWEAAGLITGRQELQLQGTFNDNGRVFIRHTDPTPLTILGLLPHLEAGG